VANRLTATVRQVEVEYVCNVSAAPRESEPSKVAAIQNCDGSEDRRLTRQQRQYRRRKALGLCVELRCCAKPELGHTRCHKHLRQVAKSVTRQRNERTAQGICPFCGVRPRFWGRLCIICRQFYSKHPLPFGARRALRFYRQAEKQYKAELIQAELRFATRKLLASGEVNGRRAEALRLYAGVDDGTCRTYSEVSKKMKLTKERVRQLLKPKRTVLSDLLDRDSLKREANQNANLS